MRMIFLIVLLAGCSSVPQETVRPPQPAEHVIIDSTETFIDISHVKITKNGISAIYVEDKMVRSISGISYKIMLGEPCWKRDIVIVVRYCWYHDKWEEYYHTRYYSNVIYVKSLNDVEGL